MIHNLSSSWINYIFITKENKKKDNLIDILKIFLWNINKINHI